VYAEQEQQCPTILLASPSSPEASSLADPDLLAFQFCEGLKADICKGIDLLPSSMPLTDLLE